MDSLGFDIIALLFLVSVLAGLVDAIAGGGGLIVLPALSIAGLDPLAVLATTKLQATFGSLTASVSFYRRGQIDRPWIGLAVLIAFASSIGGALLVLRINLDDLRIAIPVVLLLVGTYFLFAPKLDQPLAKKRLSEKTYLTLVCPLLGFYDGVFGPGAGSFITLAHRAGLGMEIRRAIAHVKPINFASNLGALIIYLFYGKALILLGLILGGGQIIGANLGSRLATKHGAKVIKPLVVTTCYILAGKLLWDQWGH